MAAEQYLDTTKVAELLSISEREVRSLCMKHERGDKTGLAGWKLGKRWRIKESALQEFVDSRSR